MLGIEANHCKVVTDSLDGLRSVDEETFASVAVLEERLEKLKKTYPIFSDIKFSSQVAALAQHEMELALS